MLASAALVLSFASLTLPEGEQWVSEVRRRSGPHRYMLRTVVATFHPRGRTVFWVRLAPGLDQFLPALKSGSTTRILFGWKEFTTRSEIARRLAGEVLEHDQCTELRSVTLTVDGRRWRVRRSLICDLLFPPRADENLLTSLSPDGRTLLVRGCFGVHGAKGWVRWTYHRDGTQTRSPADPPHAADDE